MGAFDPTTDILRVKNATHSANAAPHIYHQHLYHSFNVESNAWYFSVKKHL